MLATQATVDSLAYHTYISVYLEYTLCLYTRKLLDRHLYIYSLAYRFGAHIWLVWL